VTIKLSSQSAWFLVAGLLGATGVALDAVAAHGMSNPIAATAVSRAATYQILHAIVLLVIANQHTIPSRVARWGFLLGLFLFSGSIYCKYLLGFSAATNVAPTGGMLLIAAWLAIGMNVWVGMKQRE
jgi:uncharacterized membrane protein YgdD (TMEM256/DUF423 family)